MVAGGGGSELIMNQLLYKYSDLKWVEKTYVALSVYHPLTGLTEVALSSQEAGLPDGGAMPYMQCFIMQAREL